LLYREALDPHADQLIDKAHVTVLLDTVKCFEHLSLHHVWYRDRKKGVPARLLRLVMIVFSFARTIMVQGSASDLVVTVGAIIAGSRFSCALLHLVLVALCDSLITVWPALDLTKFVDDLSFVLFDTIGNIIDQLPLILVRLFRLLAELDLEPSLDVNGKVGKTVAIASHKVVQDAVALSLVLIGVHFDARARNLGIDQHGHGKANGTSTKSRRCGDVTTRAAKLRKLKKVEVWCTKL
jgi:hypothetical protein